MVTTLRIEEGLKKDCEIVLNDLGLNMTSAISLFLRQVVKQRGIPFALTCERRHYRMDVEMESNLRKRGRVAKRYFSEMRDARESDMTLDEINSEIAAARQERHAKERNLS